MTREEAKEFYTILQAYAEGKVIECRTKPSTVKGTSVPNDWTEMKEIEFWNNTEYRVKPEQKYRPFRDAKECWHEMEIHHPFGWVKDRKGSKLVIENVDSRGCVEVYNGGACSLNEVFEYFTFVDGLPFGVKVEE